MHVHHIVSDYEEVRALKRRVTYLEQLQNETPVD
jgi:hypothetical protein